MRNRIALAEAWKTLALAWTGACLLLVFLNLALLLASDIRHRSRIRALAASGRLKAVLPELDAGELETLIEETENRRIVYEPFTQFKERPFVGRYVNVAEAGFRLSKGQRAWPPDPVRFNVFVFGGSTAFGWGVTDHQTVASFLSEGLSTLPLGQEPAVYNFGRGAYYSNQERVLFEQLLTQGSVPRMAIFIDGLNEIGRNAPVFTWTLEDLFNHDESQSTAYLRAFLREIPLGRAAAYVRGRASSLFRRSAAGPGGMASTRALELIDRYRANKMLIEAAARQYGVVAVFVWQPVPSFRDHRAQQAKPWPVVGSFYEHMAEVVDRRDLGRGFLWCADVQDGLAEPLYVDAVHYSPGMARRIAQRIIELLVERGLLPASA